MIDTILQATYLAVTAHAGQTRMDKTTPYVVHPIDVASKVAALTKGADNNVELVVAALLHDVVEDTSMGLDVIKSFFGPKVSELVLALTKDEIKIKAIGKTEYMQSLMTNLSDDALLIKLADCLSNVTDFSAASDSFIQKYVRETKHMLDALKIRGELTTPAEKLRVMIEAAVYLHLKDDKIIPFPSKGQVHEGL